ncbi:putative nucleoside permease NupX isoform X5 [Dermacentor albipictus]|uniref:putative nucleoside permease NupX isoform X5 n=1 Tax=Dermacentor albipictus TaxID=60249 RepID=UPI0031FD0F05
MAAMKKPAHKTSFAVNAPPEHRIPPVEGQSFLLATQPDSADRNQNRKPLLAPSNIFESTLSYTRRQSTSAIIEQLVPVDHSMPSQTTSTRYSLEGWRRHWPHWRAAQRLSEALLVLLYHAYLAWCVQHGWHRGGWCSGGRFLLALTLLVYVSLAVFGAAASLEAVARSRPGLGGLFAWRNRIWGTCLAVLFGAMLWDMNGELKRMSSLAGIVLLLLLGYVFSKNRNRVLPSLCYMAALLRILYYVGFMQAFLGNIHHYVNVGPSFNSYEVLIALVSAVNGPVESMLIVHPYLLTMSRSSLHCILTLDCGTVSGRLMPVYVDLGVNSTYLVSATILSVPAALAYSKLVYPETDENSQLILEYHSPERNLIEAILTGAMIGVYLMLAVAGNMLTYASVARFFDALVAWTANNVGVDELTLQRLVEMAYRPLVLLMGVSWRDSHSVAQLLAIKVFLNEYVALTAFVKTAHNLEERSRMLATFALCDSSNVGVAGTIASLLSMLCPRRSELFASVVGYAFFSSLATSVLAACVAGCLTR